MQKKRNDDKKYYPIWGTCLGFEELIVSFAGESTAPQSSGWDDRDQYHKIYTEELYWSSDFFGKLGMISLEDHKKVLSQDIPYYHHDEGISEDDFNKSSSLKKNLDILGYSKTSHPDKPEFIAILEAKKYPMYFTQFHPEKHQFEKKSIYDGLDRSQSTIKLMSAYIFEFVERTRKYAQPMSKIPEWVQAYFSFYQTPKLSPAKSFERIYVFNSYFKSYPSQTGRVMRLLQDIKDSQKHLDVKATAGLNKFTKKKQNSKYKKN